MVSYTSRTKSSKDDWETPQYFFDLLNKEFKFKLDACATRYNSKCSKWYDPSYVDSLTEDWYTYERVFCNPPYKELGKWMEKAYRESKKGCTVVMICPSRTDTKYWHKYAMKAKEIRFCVGRISFLLDGKKGSSPNFPLCVIVFKGPRVGMSCGGVFLGSYPKISSFYHK